MDIDQNYPLIPYTHEKLKYYINIFPFYKLLLYPLWHTYLINISTKINQINNKLVKILFGNIYTTIHLIFHINHDHNTVYAEGYIYHEDILFILKDIFRVVIAYMMLIR